jgi:hypothetical protein
LSRFLRAAEEGYQSNPYHNAVHAANVVRGWDQLLRMCGLCPAYADSCMQLAGTLAAVGVLAVKGLLSSVTTAVPFIFQAWMGQACC